MEVAEPRVPRWDAEAHAYDDEPDHGLRDPAVRHAWRHALRNVLPSPPADVLDVACGTGSLAVLVAEDAYRVTGIDASSAMLAVARRKARDARVALTLHRRDVAMPIDLGRFDIVLARYVVWLLPDPTAAVRLWLEILRPGGDLVLIEDRFWPTGHETSSDLLDVVRPVAGRITTSILDDPALWGGMGADDERLLLVCR
jgi:ubiquinone/menaquinone biosynthesis C-methylase UbiE